MVASLGRRIAEANPPARRTCGSSMRVISEPVRLQQRGEGRARVLVGLHAQQPRPPATPVHAGDDLLVLALAVDGHEPDVARRPHGSQHAAQAADPHPSALVDVVVLDLVLARERPAERVHLRVVPLHLRRRAGRAEGEVRAGQTGGIRQRAPGAAHVGAAGGQGRKNGERPRVRLDRHAGPAYQKQSARVAYRHAVERARVYAPARRVPLPLEEIQDDRLLAVPGEVRAASPAPRLSRQPRRASCPSPPARAC